MKNKFLRQPNIANGSISFLLATLLNLVAQSIVGIVIFSLSLPILSEILSFASDVLKRGFISGGGT